MNKFTIPSILVATVLVAGMFAFMPVEQASTVHTSDDTKESIAAAAGLVRVEVAGIVDSTGLSGFVTFDRTGGAGAFYIQALYLCDMETDTIGFGSPEDFEHEFKFQIETDGTGGTGAKMANVLGHPMRAATSGHSGMADGECFSILTQTNFQADTWHTGYFIPGTPVPLLGDENNNVIVFMKTDSGGFSNAPNDGATMVAYISGVAAGEMSAVETDPSD